MKSLMLLYAFLGAGLVWTPRLSVAENAARSSLTFSCAADNDLYLALGRQYPRFDAPRVAIQKAVPGSAVLLLADQYPTRTVVIDPVSFDLAQTNKLRLFVEYPSTLPGLEVSAARATTWERIVVSSDRFAPDLPRLRILSAHDCHYVPVSGVPNADLVVARVAGYDTALYGIPQKDAFPILFELPESNLLVAATRLSGFVTGRYAPTRDWQLLWERILRALDPGHSHPLHFRPVVEAAYSATARLPRRYQRQAFDESARWYLDSGLLVNSLEKQAVHQALAQNNETTAPPGPGAPHGNGSLGILEGYASGILWNGNQVRRLPLRADCNADSAAVLALDGLLNRRKQSSSIASNLLDFVYFTSGMCQGARADPRHGAYGLIGWGDVAPAWLIANYGDDNARAMLSTAVVAACLKTGRWDERLMRALLANLRTTGKLGFRTDRIDLPALEKNGWRPYYEGEPVDYSPHFESYLWACYLWAWHHTGFRPFLDRAGTAIRMTMKVYPDQWRWQDNLERAHMLLCLAWLVRVEDTPEHREWLARVAGDLLAWQQPSGAIHERLVKLNGGHYRVPERNEDYGTAETPLLQQNGDPVADQLYTTGFALLGLHEAAGATGDPKLKRAEDKLAEFLCRIQTHSRKFPYLNGTWFRAFDDRRWEAWASSADIGWGAWSIEAGWGQAWSGVILALRELHTTLWDFTATTRIRDHFNALRAQMLPDSP